MANTSSGNKDGQTMKTNNKKNPLQHLIAGGCAGFVESSICHPLDTIKTRMQLRRQTFNVEEVVVRVRSSFVEPALQRLQNSLQEPAASIVQKTTVVALHEPSFQLTTSSATAIHPMMTTATEVIKPTRLNPHEVMAPLGPFGTAQRIIQREGFCALYKGLSAVWTGIVPKMAIRFVSFEQYREALAKLTSNTGPVQSASNTSVTFVAGLASGLTEAVLVVTPAEVCKIRMQSQHHSLLDPAQMQHRKYTNVFQTAFTIVKDEGIGALYKGVVPTMLRQGCNQAVNFTGYNVIKQKVMEWENTDKLHHWQSLVIGGVSGGMGPLVNNPLDVVKTRLQKQVVHPGKDPKYQGMVQACFVIAREEGMLALWKGIVPRLLRIVPGQAITFMTYEAVSTQMDRFNLFGQQ